MSAADASDAGTGASPGKRGVPGEKAEVSSRRARTSPAASGAAGAGNAATKNNKPTPGKTPNKPFAARRGFTPARTAERAFFTSKTLKKVYVLALFTKRLCCFLVIFTSPHFYLAIFFKTAKIGTGVLREVKPWHISLTTIALTAVRAKRNALPMPSPQATPNMWWTLTYVWIAARVLLCAPSTRPNPNKSSAKNFRPATCALRRRLFSCFSDLHGARRPQS